MIYEKYDPLFIRILIQPIQDKHREFSNTLYFNQIQISKKLFHILMNTLPNELIFEYFLNDMESFRFNKIEPSREIL